ncbi:hypothetical protein MN608_09071 [Microdochium nivale]|nr:hypothetical protein MN608_09071 [Microdochium nivale]
MNKLFSLALISSRCPSTRVARRASSISILIAGIAVPEHVHIPQLRPAILFVRPRRTGCLRTTAHCSTCAKYAVAIICQRGLRAKASATAPILARHQRRRRCGS